MHMKKVRTTINLNEDVVNRAKELGINISAVAEMGIINYIKEIENIGRENTETKSFKNTNDDGQSSKRNIKNKSMGLPRFELEFLAPKAKRMDQATPQARQLLFGETEFSI